LRSSGTLFALIAVVAVLLTVAGAGKQRPENAAVAAPLATPASGSPAEIEIGLIKVSDGLADPVDVAAPDDGSDRLFVVERHGRIRVIDASGALLDTPFLDVDAQVQASYLEQGLLGLAFHPIFRSNGRFFVAYTDFRTNGDTFVVEFAVSRDDPNLANPKSGRLMLAVDQPFVEHNGGTLRFGPDGYLYIGLGDGGHNGDPYDSAQDRTSLLGKLLRIDVDAGGDARYGIPPDNPFVGLPRADSPFGPTAPPTDPSRERRGRRQQFPKAVLSETSVIEQARPEIWDLGLRNPWQFSFDPETGDLYIPDVGHRVWEEVNVEHAGGVGGVNYGWDWQEGAHCYPDTITHCPRQQIGALPVSEYAHGDDHCAIVSIGVYRGTISPSLAGIYFHADLCSGTIWGMERRDDAWWHEPLHATALRVNGSGQDAAGELYLAASGDQSGPYVDPYANPTGTLWRIVSAADVADGAVLAPAGTPTAPATSQPTAMATSLP
jgi:glucose/arabinose dehydrogenase